MPRRVGEIAIQRAADERVGRAAELAVLFRCLEEDGPLVVHVHGLVGVGKSTLLSAFVARARARGAIVVRLDCRAVEPTERGFLRELDAAIGGAGADVPTAEDAAERLGALGPRVALALDTYEVFRPLDTWLRQVFVPAVGENVRVLFFGREPPVPAWETAPGWDRLFRRIALGPLAETDALALLARAGLAEVAGRRVNRFARGHPLALTLAVAAARERADVSVESIGDAVTQGVVDALVRLFLEEVSDPLTRRALDAAAVARRVTLPLLGAMLPDVAPRDAFERLAALPFAETTRDGLHLHEAVQQAAAARLAAVDPAAHRAYRRAAWRHLRNEAGFAPKHQLWRYTADLLYLLENPIVREAFFPSGAPEYAVEPARPEDGAALRAISARYEPPAATAPLERWWAQAPQTFRVVRDGNGAAGYVCLFDPTTVPGGLLRDDPITRPWTDHLRRDPVPAGQCVLFNPRWLSRDHGDSFSPVQAATWLEIKRTYMELRPRLRRIYCAERDVEASWPALRQLGFRRLPEADVDVGGATFRTVMLDFGPSSVDGWLACLVGAELGVEDDDLFDVAARELVLDGARVGLTRLEFEVLRYLHEREGRAVSRQSLLADVWGYEYQGGSNVVESVVRGLRKKLGQRAGVIQTVPGVGYRFSRG